MDRTGYQLDITTGQRKYGGPPPNWEGTQPGAGHEVNYRTLNYLFTVCECCSICHGNLLLKCLFFFYSQVFCGKIPKDVFEDELIPLFEKCGQIWDLRLMMDPLTGLNRGYCFVTYCDKDGASEAVKQVCFFVLFVSVHWESELDSI